jgi:hypothetical protein
MEWILIVWILGDPSTTGVLTQSDEATCERSLSIWEGMSDHHEGICLYGNIKELNLEEYRDTK